MRGESSNIANEFRIKASEVDFDVARDWMRLKFGHQYGVRLYASLYIYFDTPDLRLLRACSSFYKNGIIRFFKNRKINEYCLETTVDNNGLIHRRRFYTNSVEPIDLLDPFYRSLVIVRKLLPHLTDSGAPNPSAIKEFNPILRIKQEREMFNLFSEDGVIRTNIALDLNTAEYTKSTTGAEIVSWREIEVSSHHSFDQSNLLCESVANDICVLLGSSFESPSRYAFAHGQLSQVVRNEYKTRKW